MSQKFILPSGQAVTRFWRGGGRLRYDPDDMRPLPRGEFRFIVEGSDAELSAEDCIKLGEIAGGEWSDVEAGESGGSRDAPRELRGQVSAPFAIAAGDEPPVLPKGGGAERRTCPFCGRDFLSIADGGSETCINCGRWIEAPTVTKGGGSAYTRDHLAAALTWIERRHGSIGIQIVAEALAETVPGICPACLQPFAESLIHCRRASDPELAATVKRWHDRQPRTAVCSHPCPLVCRQEHCGADVTPLSGAPR